MKRKIQIKTDGLQSQIKPLGDNIIVELVDLHSVDTVAISSFKEQRNESQISWGFVTHVGNAVNHANIKVGNVVGFYKYFLTCEEIGNFELNTIKESNVIAKLELGAMCNG